MISKKGISLYTDLTHYIQSFRTELHPLLRPFVKGQAISFNNLVRTYGESISRFNISDHIDDSTIAILPMSWNFYKFQKNEKQAFEFIAKAEKSLLNIIAWSSGDTGVSPLDERVVTFRSSGYKSKLLPNEKNQPLFFKDPLEVVKDGISVRQKQTLINVGFCGFTSGNPLQWVKQIVSISYNNLLFHSGINVNEPQSLMSALYLRNLAMLNLQKNAHIKTNFIARKKYRAGAKTSQDIERTTIEFYRNIIENDYTLCIRGGGNFSKRFYETLALGRIPILIDTDCHLPFEDTINWHDHILRVRVDQIPHLSKILIEYHNSISEEEFQKKQSANRKLWEEWLNGINFYAKYFEIYENKK